MHLYGNMLKPSPLIALQRGAFLKRLAYLLAAHIIPVPERIINQCVQLRHVHLALSVQHPLVRSRVHNLSYHAKKASLLQHIGQLALHHQHVCSLPQ